MSKDITVLYKKPFEEAKVITIKDDYKELQRLVDGWIEIVDFPDLEGVQIVCNEEGKLEGLDPNVYIYGGLDLIVGSAVIIGTDGYGESISLTPEQIKDAQEYIEDNLY